MKPTPTPTPTPTEITQQAAIHWIAQQRHISARWCYTEQPMCVDFPDESGKFPAAPEGMEDFAWTCTFEILPTNVVKFHEGTIREFINGAPQTNGDAVFYTPKGVRPL